MAWVDWNCKVRDLGFTGLGFRVMSAMQKSPANEPFSKVTVPGNSPSECTVLKTYRTFGQARVLEYHVTLIRSYRTFFFRAPYYDFFI